MNCAQNISPSMRAVAAAAIIIALCSATNASASGASLDGLHGVMRVHSAQIGSPGCLSATAYGGGGTAGLAIVLFVAGMVTFFAGRVHVEAR